MKCLALCAALLAASPAAALVGATTADEALAARTVMVLKRAKATAGFCTGVVLAADVVLTAGHCVAGPADTRVHFRDASGAPVMLDVARVAVHPLYRPDAPRTRERSIDLALVKLATPLPNRFVAAELDRDGRPIVGELFRIGGYGVAREGDGRSGGVFRAASLVARAPLSSILLWADSGDGSARGACTGDSGGPMTNVSGRVVAVTVWSSGLSGRGCGGVTQGALVAPQRGWIDGVLAGWR